MGEPGPASNDGCPEEDPPGDDDGDNGTGGSGTTDSDGDDVPDDEDNCPATSNPDQTNTDGDADGDACDSDDDNDGVPDDKDNCPQTPNAAQVDQNENSVGAVCDPDEPQYNEASWQIDVPEGTDNVTLQLEYRASSGSDTSAELELNDGQSIETNVLEDRDTFTRREIDLGSYEGETVTVNLSATGDASVSVRGFRVYQDSDGDGLTDYRESQRWTNPQGLGVPFRLDPEGADTDGDGLSDGTEVTLKPVPSNAGSVLQVESGIANPARPDTDDDGLVDSEELSRNTSPFRLDSDGDDLVDGREIKVGTSPTDFDTDEDGLSDSQELELSVMRSNQIRSTIEISTNPTTPDTDGDGLTDRDELKYRSAQDRYQLESDPRFPDTDGDGLSDLEENRTGSDPMDENTDNDQFIDARDPNVTTENRPLEIVNPRSEVEIDINAYYNNHVGSTWSTESTEVTQKSGDRYRVEFDGSGVLKEQPDKYWINITDEYGNERVILIEPEGESANLALAGTAVFGAPASGVGSAGTGLIISPAGIAVGGIAVGVAGYIAYEYEYENPNNEILHSMQATGSAQIYRPDNPDLPTEITLPVGGYAVEEGVEVGYGWEYIKETTSLTQEEIGNILATGEVIIQDNKRRIIADLPSGEEIVLTIVGGTLATASVGDTVADPCGEIVNTDENVEHATRDGEGDDNKPIDDASTLRELIRNEVVKIVEVSSKRYYVVQFGTNRFAVLVASGAEGYWTLQTILTANRARDNIFRTIRDALKGSINAGEESWETKYDPDTRPDC